MVQDAVLLDTRQHELRHTVNRRKRKLQELYRVTCATANALIPRSINDSQPHATKATLTESAFLDANDIVKGRVFDVSTLRRLPGAEPLHDADGSWLGAPQQYAKLLPRSSQPEPPNTASLANSAGQSDNIALPAPPQASSLSAPNGISGRSRPRSPISPVEDNDGGEPSVKIDAAKANVPTAGALTSLKSRTPATPPAEASDSTNTPNNERDVAPILRGAIKEQDSGTDVQPPQADPGSQLLQEVAKSQIGPSDESSKSLHNTSQIQPQQTPNLSAQTPNMKAHPGMNASVQSRAATARPPPRIDTSGNGPLASVLANATPATATTPASAMPGHASPPPRMRTRVSSGAIRHKSVSEILGETPRTAHHERTPSVDKTIFSPADSVAPSRRFSQVSATPDTATFKRRLSDLRGKEKDLSHQSMVVFARQTGHEESTSKEVVAKRGALQGVDDYLLPLFLAQASGHSTGLAQLLSSSRKTLTTANHHLEARELRDCRILKRIYTLQSTNKWSLRQPARAVEPERPATQWDALLTEARWMRTDFREERKWKHAQAKLLAHACAEWVAADDDERKELQIKTRKPTLRALAANGMTPESTPNANSQDDVVPDLVPSNEDDTSEEADDDMQLALSAPLPPAAVFSLGADDLTFALGKTPIAKKLLDELPLYDPFRSLELRSRATDNRSMDESWKKPMTLVSKWNDGKIIFPDESANKRRKVSRYDYAAIPEPEDVKAEPLPPEETNVAMFRPENRHIIHRLHTSHAFRLPPMPIPSQDFFLNRQPSQWTRQEEDALRRFVKEYAFNWSLIASMLASSSIYSSGAERRTPWECFERWEMLEGMPAEYARHEFYKRWHLRRQNAKQRHEEQFRQAQEQSQGQTSQQVQRLRRNGEPQTVDRRRNDKHIYIFQSMAKLAKKKEAQLQKQQHMAAVAATRKGNEPAQPAKPRMRTPAEFSNHKHKQEQDMRQKLLEHRQQLRAQQVRAAGAAPTGVPLVPVNRGSVPSNVPAGQASQVQAGLAATQNRLVPPGQATMNGTMANGARAPVAAQLPVHYQQSQANTNTSTNARVLAEASRVSEQQRLMQQSRQFTGINGTGQQTAGLSLPTQPSASYQSMQQQAGKLSPAVNGQRPGSSPRGAQAIPANAQNLSSGMTPQINAITSRLKSMHPTLTDLQISQLATQQLNAQLQAQNHQTTSSVYQTPSRQTSQQGQSQVNNLHVAQPGMSNGMNAMNSQQYAAAMRHQMQQQSSRAGTNGTQPNQHTQAAPRPESRGVTATPQNRASTATPSQAAASTSQSPRPASAQVANKS